MRFRNFIMFATCVMNFSPLVATSAEKFDGQMQKIVEPYLEIQTLLASDATKGIEQLAKNITLASKNLDTSSIPKEHADEYKNFPTDISKYADELAKAKDLESMRTTFKKLSKPLTKWAGIAKPKDLVVIYCPMADANWVQKGKETHNPYYGKEMLSCGKIVK